MAKFYQTQYVLEKDWEDDVKLLRDLEWPDISLPNPYSK